MSVYSTTMTLHAHSIATQDKKQPFLCSCTFSLLLLCLLCYYAYLSLYSFGNSNYIGYLCTHNQDERKRDGAAVLSVKNNGNDTSNQQGRAPHAAHGGL